MLKFSLLLFATIYLVMLVAGLVLWAAATATGVRGNVEKFIGDLIASDNFHLLGGTMIRASVLGGAVLVVLGTGAMVLFAVLYNLISDVVGGVIVVFEERPLRRRAAVRAANAAPAVTLEEPVEPLQPRARARDRARRASERVWQGDSPGPDPVLEPVQPEAVTPAELSRPAD